MSLLIPETGLLFWMLLAFGVVFFVLAKYGWPAIVNMVEERSDFINNSVKIAEEAHLQLENIKLTSDNILSETRQKQMDILQEGSALRAKMIDEAKEQANANAEKIIASARLEIQKERDLALGDIKRQVAELSLEIAEKIVRQQLGNNEEQRKLVEKLLEEIKIQS